MKILSADYIFPAHLPPMKNAAIQVGEDGRILDLLPKYGYENAEYFPGILLPGFVNVHCHLELSFALARIHENRGINDFITQLEALKRSVSDEEKLDAIYRADQQMLKDGVVAVGDIMNTALSLEVKKKSPISYCSFIEVYGSDPAVAEYRFQRALDLYVKGGKRASIVPHAPYSLSRELFLKVKKHQHENEGIQSIHYMESKGERLYFEDGSGPVFDRMHEWGVEIPDFIPTGKSSVESIAPWINHMNKTIFVHNTFIKEGETNFINSTFNSPFYAICPNANLYIEQELPPNYLLESNDRNICIGTDSLASNHQLSVYEEVKTILKNYPAVDIFDALRWATINGARALGIDDRYGSFEIGKRPGVVWINPGKENDKPVRIV